MLAKRMIIASILGAVCGVICLMLGHFAAKAEFTVVFIAGGMFNRTLMGFVIGMTSFRLTPFVRGPILGLLMSVGPAIAMPMENAIPYCVAGTVYGFLIDVLTSKAFKANVGG